MERDAWVSRTACLLLLLLNTVQSPQADVGSLRTGRK
jgi:hypothetical protein